MKNFDIPSFYRSSIISKIKDIRKEEDKMKKDFSPTVLDFGSVKFLIARHFGFCYGVENAIEIVYKTISENPNKRIFLLSEMIHNPKVNDDLQSLGVQFIMDTKGNQFIHWDEITKDDIVVIPAFGTTIEIEQLLAEKGIETKEFNTTCPFVERVWKRSSRLGEDDFTIVIHGKQNHEETRATFSHSKSAAPSIVIQNIDEAKTLAKFIRNEEPTENFDTYFKGRYSDNFSPKDHLKKMGVVNQTTMLATETQEIADFLKSETLKANQENTFADTRDTLCYATSDNQNAVYGLLEHPADLAIVVGGYNSSNTSHLVELCEEKITTYHISGAEKLIDENTISHYKFRENKEVSTNAFLQKKPTILITSGASCPDATVEEVLLQLLSYFPNSLSIDEVLGKLN